MNVVCVRVLEIGVTVVVCYFEGYSPVVREYARCGGGGDSGVVRALHRPSVTARAAALRHCGIYVIVAVVGCNVHASQAAAA